MGFLKRGWHVIQKGVLWLLVLTAQCSLTGTDFGNDYTFECAEGAYISEVTVDGFMGLILTCSDGEVSKGFGSDVYTFLLEEDFTGKWTRLPTTLSLFSDTPSKASLSCFNKGDPSDTSLGPYRSESNPGTSAEISSSFDDGSYAVGVTVFKVCIKIYGVALHCRAIDEASRPAPDGLVLPGTPGTTADDIDDPSTSNLIRGATSESTTEPTPELTPTGISPIGQHGRFGPPKASNSHPSRPPSQTWMAGSNSREGLNHLRIMLGHQCFQPRPARLVPWWLDMWFIYEIPAAGVPSRMPKTSLPPILTPAYSTFTTPAPSTLLTLDPISDLNDAPLKDAEDVAIGRDAGNWIKALTVILSTVAAAVAFFAFVFHRLRRNPEDGTQNGGINGNTITCVFGCHNSIGDTINITPPEAEGRHNNVADGCTSGEHGSDDIFFSARSSPVHVGGFCNDIGEMPASL